MSNREPLKINKELLNILVCTVCKSDVKFEDGKIVCRKCGRRYPVKDDISIMLVDDAEEQSDRTKEI